MVNRTFLDYYKCPGSACDFVAALGLPRLSGYFMFEGQVCYGASRLGNSEDPLNAGMHESADGVQQSEGSVRFPFSPDDVVTSLRTEAYATTAAAKSDRLLNSRPIRAGYYLARPALPVRVRRHLQRFHLRNWRRTVFPSWPVDTTVDQLMRRWMRLALASRPGAKIPFIWFWPEGHCSCAIVTHDVEHEAGRAFSSRLMDIDDHHRVKSSFQVVPEKRYRVTPEFLASIAERGFEVNVHDLNHDGHLFERRDVFERRKAKIQTYRHKFHAEGFRSAAMYRKAEWIAELGFTYDMSMPSAAHLEPQSGGCCTVMPFFNGGTVELPLTTTQDYSLFHILRTHTLDLWLLEIECILKNHGLITILVHPDYVIEQPDQKLYAKLLHVLSDLRDEGRIWLPLPREAAQWWHRRSKMQLHRKADQWQITGEGAERARVAYAELRGDEVVYCIATDKGGGQFTEFSYSNPEAFASGVASAVSHP